MNKKLFIICTILLMLNAVRTYCMQNKFEMNINGFVRKGLIFNEPILIINVIHNNNHQLIACNHQNAYYKNNETKLETLNIEDPQTNIAKTAKELFDFLNQAISPNKADFVIKFDNSSEGSEETKDSYYTEKVYTPYTLGLWHTVHKKEIPEEHFTTLKNIAQKLLDEDLKGKNIE